MSVAGRGDELSLKKKNTQENNSTVFSQIYLKFYLEPKATKRFMPFFFSDYDSYKVGITKVVKLNIIQTGCFPSVLNNNNSKIFPSKTQF